MEIPIEAPLVSQLSNSIKMASIHVLFDGFSEINENGSEMKANCTCTLIKDEVNIIVDTMTAWDGDKIVRKLEKYDIKPDDISYVICTHGHSDHIGNNNLFLNATHIVGNSISKGENYFLHDLNNQNYKISDNIEVMFTPGHTLSDVSVIVRSKDLVYSIVGDLFEKEQDIEDDSIWIEAGSEDQELQRKNRKKIIEMSDFIIPGHGPIFEVKEEYKKLLLEA